jgi:hypothetical protein
MISGKVYGPNAPADGARAIKLEDLGEGWVLVMMIEVPEMPFPGMVREEHAMTGRASIYEAKAIDSAPTFDDAVALAHMQYKAD